MIEGVFLVICHPERSEGATNILPGDRCRGSFAALRMTVTGGDS